MALIKHDIADELARHAVVLDLSDLNRQAEQIIDRAHVKARSILQDAQREAQQLVDTAEGRGHARGYEEGLAEGLEQGLTEGRDQALRQHACEIEVLTESWRNALYHWDLTRNQMFLEAREDVLTFAFAAAGKIVRRLVQLDPSVVETQLEEALDLLSAPSSVEIVINPQDRALVEHALQAMTGHLTKCRHAALVEDASVDGGGCIVRTAGGAVDASINKQLERIAAVLLPGRTPDDDNEPSADDSDQSRAGAPDT